MKGGSFIHIEFEKLGKMFTNLRFGSLQRKNDQHLKKTQNGCKFTLWQLKSIVILKSKWQSRISQFKLQVNIVLQYTKTNNLQSYKKM